MKDTAKIIQRLHGLRKTETVYRKVSEYREECGVCGGIDIHTASCTASLFRCLGCDAIGEPLCCGWCRGSECGHCGAAQHEIDCPLQG